MVQPMAFPGSSVHSPDDQACRLEPLVRNGTSTADQMASLDGVTEPAPVPQLRAAGELRLDVDGARDAVAALEGARDKLLTLKRNAAQVARAALSDRTTHDLISSEAFLLLSLKADGGPGSLTAAVDGAVEHVQQLIDQMKSDIAEHERLDDAAAASLRA